MISTTTKLPGLSKIRCCIWQTNGSILLRAIALSLQEAPAVPGPPAAVPVAPNNIPVEFEDEDDDPEFREQLRRAIAESQATTATQQPPPARERDYAEPPAPAAARPQTSAFLSDRAKLERERLERQKRQRPDLAQTGNVIPKDEEDDDVNLVGDIDRDVKRQRVSHSVTTARTDASSSSKPLTSASANTRAAVNSNRDAFFYDGELRQTANKHADPVKETRPVFRLTEILSPVSDSALCNGCC
jgi:tyrosyl-DNA phosphodiesterase 1